MELDKDELDAIGKGADELLNEIGLSPLDLIDAGFDPEVVVDAALASTGFDGPNGLGLSDLTVIPDVSPALLKRKGIGANELRAAGVSKDELAFAGFSDAEVKASKAFAPKGSASSTSTVIIVAVVALCIVVVAAVIVIKKRSGGEAEAGPAVAFENPMYAAAGAGADAQSGYMDVPANDQSGYMDVPATGAYADMASNQAAYMDIAPNTNPGQQQAQAYMDVAPAAGDGGASAGYMDINAGGAADLVSSDEEV